MSSATSNPPSARRAAARWIGLTVLVAAGALAVTALLVSIFERKQEAREPFVRVVEVDELSSDPVPWGANWPHQFDAYRRTVDVTRTRYGGSSAMPEQKLEASPWLRAMYAGYAFALDYRERRGHAYMLHDQEVTERVTERPQPGACLHCHASVVPTWRRLGLEALGEPATPAALAEDFHWPAVMRGFERMTELSYAEAHAELLATPDGTPGESPPLFPGGTETPRTPAGEAQAEAASHADAGQAHPVSCIDCHDPDTMLTRVTRPGFVRGIRALAESEAEVPHLPSIARWRAGDRQQPYDPNVHATRQEMRSFVCGQCHVEYYCGPKTTLFFPWDRGLRVEQIEESFDHTTFPDGSPFADWVHGMTGAPVYKAQHPEFEMWSQGIHARAGVSCADCHMPYERVGALKISDHWVRSPLLNVNNACQVCHNVPEAELVARVHTIQDRTHALMQRAAAAVVEMLEAVRDAAAAGVAGAQLAELHQLQRSAQWRLDFVSSENSMGFHADQEAARILGESIDYARQAVARARVLALTSEAEPVELPPIEPVHGVTPTAESPPGPYLEADAGGSRMHSAPRPPEDGR